MILSNIFMRHTVIHEAACNNQKYAYLAFREILQAEKQHKIVANNAIVRNCFPQVVKC